MNLPPEYRKLLLISSDRVVILVPTDPIDVMAVRRAIIFVFAEWSMASLVSFRTLNEVLNEPLYRENDLPLYVLNTDDPETGEFMKKAGTGNVAGPASRAGLLRNQREKRD